MFMNNRFQIIYKINTMFLYLAGMRSSAGRQNRAASPLPAACLAGVERPAICVAGRFSGAAKAAWWFVGECARHGIDCCCSSFISRGQKRRPRERSSRVTVATFRAMKHEPTGGEVRGADRRWRDITDIASPPTS